MPPFCDVQRCHIQPSLVGLPICYARGGAWIHSPPSFLRFHERADFGYQPGKNHIQLQRPPSLRQEHRLRQTAVSHTSSEGSARESASRSVSGICRLLSRTDYRKHRRGSRDVPRTSVMFQICRAVDEGARLDGQSRTQFTFHDLTSVGGRLERTGHNVIGRDAFPAETQGMNTCCCKQLMDFADQPIRPAHDQAAQFMQSQTRRLPQG